MIDNNQDYTRREVRSRSITVLIFAIVLALAIVILSSLSFGWFTTTKEVNGGITVSPKVLYVDAEFTCERKGFDGIFVPVASQELDGTGIFPLGGLYPGDVLRFTVKLTNTSVDISYTDLSLSLIGASGESPLVSLEDAEQRRYWMSSQLRVTSVTLSAGASGDILFGEGFLFDPSDMDMTSSDPSSPVYTKTDATPEDIKLATVDLAVGETVTVTVLIEFYNSEQINQDAYKSFGEADEGGEYPKGYIRRQFLLE